MAQEPDDLDMNEDVEPQEPEGDSDFLASARETLVRAFRGEREDSGAVLRAGAEFLTWCAGQWQDVAGPGGPATRPSFAGQQAEFAWAAEQLESVNAEAGPIGAADWRQVLVSVLRLLESILAR